MPVTSVDIDSDVLQQAKEAFGVKTNREAIDLALREAVMRQRQHAAIDLFASLALEAGPARSPMPTSPDAN
jgi:Arc/MetJ family transcription regulator